MKQNDLSLCFLSLCFPVSRKLRYRGRLLCYIDNNVYPCRDEGTTFEYPDDKTFKLRHYGTTYSRTPTIYGEDARRFAENMRRVDMMSREERQSNKAEFERKFQEVAKRYNLRIIL